MFDFAEEAISALASKSARSKANADEPQLFSLRYLAASHSAGIVYVKFMQTEFNEADKVSELRNDLSELAGALINGSRVLLDFEGLPEFGTESIEELANFHRKLQAKGSRIVLCNLSQAVEASFFPQRSSNEGN